AQDKTILYCPACHKQFNVMGFRPGRKARCKDCRADLVDRPDAPPPLSAGFLQAISLPPPGLGVTSTVLGAVVDPAAGDSSAEGVDIGGYVLIHLLAENDTGDLYEAKNSRSGNRCLLKIVAGYLAESSTLEADLRHVGDATDAAGVPALLPVTEVTRGGDSLYYVMPHSTGVTLREAMSRGRVNVEFACRVVRDLALALHALHERGFVHGNLRAETVLMTRPDDRAVITDYTLARQRGPAATAPPTDETASFAADGLDAWDDQFLLGALLYEMVSGRSVVNEVFADPDPGEAARAAATAVEHTTPPIDKAIATVVAAAVHPNKRARYPTTARLAEDLGRVAVGVRPLGPGKQAVKAGKRAEKPRRPSRVASPTAATPAAGAKRVTPANRRRTAFVAGAAGGGGLLVVLLFAWLLSGQPAASGGAAAGGGQGGGGDPVTPAPGRAVEVEAAKAAEELVARARAAPEPGQRAELLGEAWRAAPGRNDLLLERAAALLAAGQAAQAREAAAQYRGRVAGDRRGPYCSAVVTLFWFGDAAVARADLDLAAAPGPAQAEADYAFLAARWIESIEGQYTALAGHLPRLGELVPAHAEAAALAAEAAAFGPSPDLAAAQGFCEKLGAAFPNSPRALYVRACLAKAGERAVECDEAFRAVLAAAPGFQEARFAYAFFLYQQGRWKEAIDQFTRVIADGSGGDRREAFRWRAAANEQAGALDRAIEDLGETIRLAVGPGTEGVRAQAHRDRARLYKKTDNGGRELGELTQALALEPRDPASRQRRSDLHARAGRVDEALADLSALVDAYPEDSTYRHQRAAFLWRQNRLDEAATDFLRFFEILPLPTYPDEHRGRWKDAQEFCRALIVDHRAKEAEAILSVALAQMDKRAGQLSKKERDDREKIETLLAAAKREQKKE
ncbi:MAG: protein kinase, partial [Planctomycetes bacterium]|nr:protein kinase [Planctomycetota bacterium]